MTIVTKTWEVYDLKISQKTIILKEDDTIMIERKYQYLDENDKIIRELEDGIFTKTILFTELPQDMQDALIKINTYTINQINAQEGIE